MPAAGRVYGRRDSILLVTCILLALVAQFLPERMRDPLAAALRRTVLAPLVSLQRDAELSRRAWVMREARAAARDSLVLRSMELDGALAENQQLRQLLGLGARLKWGFVPAEVLHGRGVGEDYSVILSAGSRAGVRPFSPVVAPEGIVGLVRTVDPTMSSAIVWSHPDFRVSAMAEDGSAYGIVAAHLGPAPERHLLEMRGVAVRSTLEPGTVVVSSGLGGTFPRGIPIGTVLGELSSSELWARTYLLRPMVLPANMSSVMILLPEHVTAGVGGVWQTGRETDAATRRVVSAGDSLARAAARAARADSARADSVARATAPATAAASRDSLTPRDTATPGRP